MTPQITTSQQETISKPSHKSSFGSWLAFSPSNDPATVLPATSPHHFIWGYLQDSRKEPFFSSLTTQEATCSSFSCRSLMIKFSGTRKHKNSSQPVSFSSTIPQTPSETLDFMEGPTTASPILFLPGFISLPLSLVSIPDLNVAKFACVLLPPQKLPLARFKALSASIYERTQQRRNISSLLSGDHREWMCQWYGLRCNASLLTQVSRFVRAGWKWIGRKHSPSAIVVFGAGEVCHRTW